MDWNKWLRQIHRWMSMAFTAAVILNFLVVGKGAYPLWLGVVTLGPLVLLLLTGLYLFVLPYLVRWRRTRQAG